MSRKLVGPLISITLILAVAFAIFISSKEQIATISKVDVKGVSGSEKLPFFKDERTIKALSDLGIKAHVEKAGSRQIATSYDLSGYDFAFPAGIPAAEKIKHDKRLKQAYQPFFTPMVVASWKPIAEILVANGIASKRDGIYYIVKLDKLFDMVTNKVRWVDLKGSDKYPANKSVLISTTDIRKSNSAAMFLAMASYVYNGNSVVQSLEQARPIIDELAQLFLRQGFTESSSAAPFENYLTMGPGKTPMVMIYEAQFLAEAAKQDGYITNDMVLMYPEPTIFTKHVLVPTTDNGNKLGAALTEDPVLQQIATEHGLRTSNKKLFNNFVSSNNLSIPSYLVNVIEPPSYEVLEGMIQMIESKYTQNASTY